MKPVALLRAAAAICACALAMLGTPATAQPADSAAMTAPELLPQSERRLLLPAGGQEAAPKKGGGSVVNTVISLGIVLGLIFGCAAAFRKLSGARGPLAAGMGRGGRAPSGLIEVLARYPLGRGQALVLLRLDRRVLLLSQSVTGRFGCSANFTPLCEITEPEDVASILAKAQDEEGESMTARFRSLLGRFDEAGDELEEEPWLSRRAVEGERGDRAELLDESAESHASMDSSARESDLPSSLRLSRREQSGSGLQEQSLDAVGSLRQRLETLRLAEGG